MEREGGKRVRITGAYLYRLWSSEGHNSPDTFGYGFLSHESKGGDVARAMEMAAGRDTRNRLLNSHQPHFLLPSSSLPPDRTPPKRPHPEFFLTQTRSSELSIGQESPLNHRSVHLTTGQST